MIGQYFDCASPVKNMEQGKTTQRYSRDVHNTEAFNVVRCFSFLPYNTHTCKKIIWNQSQYFLVIVTIVMGVYSVTLQSRLIVTESSCLT